MEITEEQKRRAEVNRLAALEKRKRLAAGLPPDAWRLSKCPRIPCPEATETIPPEPSERPRPPVRFLAVLEICSPDEFSVTPDPLKGSPFPGWAESLRNIEACLLPVVPSRTIESQGGRMASVFKLKDYELVSRCIKKLPGVELQDIPYATRVVVEKFSHCVGDRWDPDPSLQGLYSDKKVEEYMERLPKQLRDTLLPFQLEGVRFGLRRGGRCLIADEMGLGKTIQAIAIACCFMDEGPILIVCPAVLRFSWADELEHWLPFLLPKDIHLVFGRQNSLDRLGRSPRVVVISYTMLSRLRKSMLKREWALMIVDESHNIRCTKKKSESKETKSVLEVAAKVAHIILLSGTPSLSRPYDIYHQINMLWPHLLGKDKFEFAKNYRLMSLNRYQGKTYKIFSKGIRLEELNVLLRQTLMIRRLKENVLAQLPPKRRQIIRLTLKAADILVAATSCRVHDRLYMDGKHQNEFVMKHSYDQIDADGHNKLEEPSLYRENDCKITSRHLSNQEIGIAKISGFSKWFSSRAMIKESGDASTLGMGSCCQKMIIFAHHLKVLDGLQDFICEKGIQFVRIDGSTLPRDRQAAVEAFRLSTEVEVAIIGITAGGVGLDFSAAQSVVFLELPRSASELLQAEDRAHRRGQTNAVNVYIFCGKDTSDELHWIHLNKSLFRVSCMMNGSDDAIKEIEVDGVLSLASPEVKCRTQAIKMCSKTSDVRESGAAEHNNTDMNCLGQTEHLQFEAYKTYDEIPIDDNGGADEHAEADASNPNYEESLRFEVSKYTRRVHLYICLQGKDSRPRPLFENFRPEELDSMLPSAGDTNKETALYILKENPAYYNIFQKFIEEWNGLRPIDKNKLFGKPLQIPLRLELCYLKETIKHGCGGLQKGGSKRRVTPLSDISHSLPENAIWKKVALSCGPGKEKEYTQAWTVSEEPLCKLCQEPCNGMLAKAPEFFEDLFCTLNCFQEYRIRTSQRALREALFRIEHGVCTRCKLDCHKLVECIKPLSVERRKDYIQKVAPKLMHQKKLLEKLIHEPSEGNAWHADHIIAVNNGGGECGLENMRTLCVACHYEVTKAQKVEWRFRRKREREIVRLIQKEVEDGCSSTHTNSTTDKEAEELAEESLFVAVPGSAYSTKASEVIDNQVG